MGTAGGQLTPGLARTLPRHSLAGNSSFGENTASFGLIAFWGRGREREKRGRKLLLLLLFFSSSSEKKEKRERKKSRIEPFLLLLKKIKKRKRNGIKVFLFIFSSCKRRRNEMRRKENSFLRLLFYGSGKGGENRNLNLLLREGMFCKRMFFLRTIYFP
mgnify:CR=1 FL=1